MKQLIKLSLLIVFSFTLASCGGDDKKGKKEKVKYILELSAEKFQLIENDPQILDIKSWKIIENGKYPTKAIIRIQNSEKALKIMPYSGTGRIKSQLVLKGPPAKEDFK